MRYIKFLAVLAVILCLSSCQKEAFLISDFHHIEMESEGGSFELFFTTNVNWTATVNDSWCRLSQYSGAGSENGEMLSTTIICEKNSSYNDRSCTLTLTADDLTIDITIYQYCAEALIVEQNRYEISDESQTVSVKVKKNISFDYVIDKDCQDWIRVSQTKGLDEVTVSFDIDANDNYQERVGKIRFSQSDGGLLSETVIITQRAAKKISLSTTEINLSNDAQSFSIDLNTNVEYEVTIDGEWIKMTEATADGYDYRVSFDVEKNSSYDTRKGKISFKEKNGNLSAEIDVTQSESYGIFVSTPDYEVSNERHTIAIEVLANVNYTVKSYADWIEVVETKGLSESQIILSIDGNESYDSRDGYVVVSQINGNIQDTVSIHQKETQGLFVSQDEFIVSYKGQNISFDVMQNVDYEVIIPEDAKSWVSEITTKALTSKTHTFHIEDCGLEGRNCMITVKQKDGPMCQTVSIVQSASSYEITSTSSFKNLDDFAGSLNIGRGVSKEEIAKYLSLAKIFCTYWKEPVRTYNIEYNSTSPDGEPCKLSASVFIPETAIKSGRKLKGTILAVPFFTSRYDECPTSTPSVFGLTGWFNYAVMIPDTYGFGASGDRHQAYINYESSALCEINALKALNQMIIDNNLKTNNTSFHIGYSLGAYSAMATEKYIATVPECGIPAFTKTFIAGGPYDLEATFEHFISDGSQESLPLIVNTLVSLIETEHVDVDYSDILKGEMLKHYKEWFSSKQYTRVDINNLTQDLTFANSFTDDFQAMKGTAYEKVVAAAQKNNLCTGWAPLPGSNFYIGHTEQDNFVPFQNFLNIKTMFDSNPGQYNVNYSTFPGTDHMSGCLNHVLNELIPIL